MIDEIHVKDLALIKEASLAPARGMTVVTGETGAGKTALLSAVRLLMGARADSSVVREGAKACSVEGRLFDDAADAEDEGTVVVRRVSADGRSRVTVDGSLASVSELAVTVGRTVDLCGQHEHQHLLKQAEQARMLDAWGGERVARALEAYQAAWDAAREAAEEVAQLEEAQHASAEKVDEARFVLSRIEEVAPQPGEYEELMAELPKRENAEALALAARGAHEALAGDGGAIDAVARAASMLESLAGVDERYGVSAQALREACFVLEDVGRDARSYAEEADFDPAELAAAQERAATLQGLMRSYGPRMEDVLERRDEARRIVELSGDSSALMSAARKRLEAAESELSQAADALQAERRAVAPRFALSLIHI